MSKPRTHYVTSKIDKAITTLCGRTCTEISGGSFTHDWHCSLDGKSVSMTLTVHKEDVTCKVCKSKL